MSIAIDRRLEENTVVLLKIDAEFARTEKDAHASIVVTVRQCR